MYSIIDIETGILIIASVFDIVEEGQVAIDKVCLLQTEEDIFFNFETQEFYTK
jgi:hypothetical protein